MKLCPKFLVAGDEDPQPCWVTSDGKMWKTFAGADHHEKLMKPKTADKPVTATMQQKAAAEKKAKLADEPVFNSEYHYVVITPTMNCFESKVLPVGTPLAETPSNTKWLKGALQTGAIVDLKNVHCPECGGNVFVWDDGQCSVPSLCTNDENEIGLMCHGCEPWGGQLMLSLSELRLKAWHQIGIEWSCGIGEPCAEIKATKLAHLGGVIKPKSLTWDAQLPGWMLNWKWLSGLASPYGWVEPTDLDHDVKTFMNECKPDERCLVQLIAPGGKRIFRHIGLVKVARKWLTETLVAQAAKEKCKAKGDTDPFTGFPKITGSTDWL